MTDEPTWEPIPVSLCPTLITYKCAVCGEEDEAALEEDASGFFAVPDHERYRRCEHCDAFIDVGWNGWHWHAAPSALTASAAMKGEA